MTRTLVVGVDLGPGGNRTSDVAVQFAKDLGLGLCLVHAYGGSTPRTAGMTPAAGQLADRLEADHDALLVALAAERARIESAGGRVSSARLVVGHPYEVLIEEGRSLDARFVAVGPHRPGGAIDRALGRFLGGTADAVLRHAPCPVLVTSGTQLTPLAGRVILVAIDGEPASLKALTLAMEIAAEASASVEAIYVGDDASVVDRAAAHARAHAAQSHLASVLTSVRQTTQTGALAATVLDMATRTGAALLAVGTHGRSGLSHLVVGSVAEEICRGSSVPVLVSRGNGVR